MNLAIDIKQLSKSYSGEKVVDITNLQIEPGRIVGLIGTNGAGKTSALRCLLGLTRAQGDFSVLGLDPSRERQALMRDVAFIADTAILPKWITAKQLLDYMQGQHPNFNREKAEGFLATTNIKPASRVSTLSKGMITQLHLALTIAIEAKLLLLDEPTLGLDIVYRQRFYEQLLNDYYDESRTIVITTHQVEEIERILTDVIFLQDGRVVLNESIEALAERFYQVPVNPADIERARALKPIHESAQLGSRVCVFDGVPREQLQQFGELSTPSLADLFVAKLAGQVVGE